MRPNKQWVGVTAFLLFTVSVWAGEGRIRRSSQPVKGEYIVVLHDTIPAGDVPAVARRVAGEHGATPTKIWKSALKGFLVTMTEQRARTLSHHPDVAFIEENARTFLSGTGTIKTNVDVPSCDPWTNSNCAITTDNRIWHLDRLGQTWAAPDHKHTSCDDGSGVTIYVVDTGVKGDHQEFLRANGTSRVATTGYDAANEGPYFPAHDPCNGWPGDVPPDAGRADETGRYDFAVTNGSHGTAVASLIGGNRIGVANNVTIVPVKVAPCRWAAARSRRPSTQYSVGDFVWNNTGNGSPDRYWICTIGGQSGASESFNPPNVPIGGLVTDNGVTWRREPVPSSDQTTAMIADGLDWLRDGTRNTQNSRTNAVVSMSTWRPGDDSAIGVLDLAVKNVIDAGIAVVASANNQSGDACDTSPARLSRTNPTVSMRHKVITVGGTMIRNNPDPAGVPANEAANGGPSVNQLEPSYLSTDWTRDARWICSAGDSVNCSAAPATLPPRPGDPNYTAITLGSNGGPCVTLFAPAKNLPVATMKDDANDYRDPRRQGTIASGTSFAAPIVAGVVARILQRFPGSTVDTVYSKLMAHTINDAMDTTGLDPTGVTGTPNVLLNYRDVVINTQPQDQLNTGSGVTLSVAADRTDVTYQWFKVNEGFVDKPSGAFTSQLLAGETASSLTVNPTAETRYWVRISTACSQTESRIARVTVASVSAPSSFNVSFNGGQLTFSWSAVSDATGYRIERKNPGLDWEDDAIDVPGGGTTTRTQAAPSVSEGVVLYRIRALNGPTVSAPGPSDIAYVNALEDDPLVEYVTVIKAVHLGAIRSATNALCDVLDMPRQFQPGELTLSGQPTVFQFNDTRTRLNNARQSAGLLPIAFTVTPAPGQLIITAPINDLRNGIR